ncbi:right-handed parallel beta-helix repeat-containing protein [Candidatus Woesearchaeota archaeon]|nr:right-handed parallel beta-helix repeat-containing protein [Candidatus Woesearchaeota archaeon]
MRFTAIGSFIQSDTLTITSNLPSETTLLAPCPDETGPSWTIPSGTIVDCIGKQVIVNGNIDIFGMLNIQESSFSIIVPNAVISVKSPVPDAQDDGTLIIKNSNITPLGALTTLFVAEPNTKLEIHNSNLSNLGSFYDGLTINSDNAFINNTIFTNIETIAIDGRDHIFLNNTVIGNDHTSYLIAFGWLDSSHNNTILNNSIRNVKGADAGDDDTALSVYGDNNTINFNKITGVIGSDRLTFGGRTLLEGAYPLVIGGSNNHIEQNNITENWAEADTPALLVVGHNNTILLNEVKDNSKNMDGLWLGMPWWETVENNTIIDNIIVNNPGEGIQLINAMNTTIISNLLDSNLDNGNIYLLQSNDTLLLNNRIEGMTAGITLEDSNMNIFEDNFINLTPKGFSEVANRYGILFKGISTENLFENTTIITRARQNHGIYFNGIEVKNNKILNTTIFPGRSSDGILFAGNVYNNTIESIKVKTEGTINPYNGITFTGATVQGNVIRNGDIWSRGVSSQSLFFQNNAKENKIVDTDLISLLGSKTIKVKDGTGKNYLLNVTYDDDQVLFQGTSAAYELYRQWYLNVTVVDEITHEYIQGANVTSFNITAAETEELHENFVFSDLTDITGMITRQNITEYIQNQLTKIFLNNYTFNTTEYLPDLDIYEENITSYNITNNSDVLVKLTPRATVLSLGMSETLTNGIAWDITSIPIIEQSAIGNNDDTTQITEYTLILEAQSSTPVIISIKTDNDLTNGIETIPIINEKFAYSLTDATISSPIKTSLSTEYQPITSLTLEPGIPQLIYLKFYLDIPPSQAPGSYINNIFFKLEPA